MPPRPRRPLAPLDGQPVQPVDSNCPQLEEVGADFDIPIELNSSGDQVHEEEQNLQHKRKEELIQMQVINNSKINVQIINIQNYIQFLV